jgi:hypothetical protein
MHLTNYAINKESDKFKQAGGCQDEQGHKRTLTSVFKHIDQAAQNNPDIFNSEQCWQQIKELIVKTTIACH